MGINQPQGYGAPQQPQRPNPQYSRPQAQPPHSAGPAQPQPQGYGPPPQQGMPPQYGPQGMPPQGYHMPPPKKGMPGWAIALIVVAVFLFLVIPVMALAAIPLITTNTAEARESEGEQILGSFKNQCRIAFAKTGQAPRKLTGPIDSGGTGASPPELEGKYYRAEDRVGSPSMQEGELYAQPTQRGRSANLRFHWLGGEGQLSWK
ncbi:MAG: hypothetical protein KF696_04810 [Planctomycetes bacterium]|nr:hypothetical protein [Planctomycetota bacterium]MCW8134294.1 hypothetical protein [Planctomycetota bacterium]